MRDFNPSECAKVRWEKLSAFSYPPELIERARRLRQIHPVKTVAEILHVSRQWVMEIEARNWKVKKAGRPLPERPGDFAIQCNHMSKLALARHYGVGLSTIEKWLVGINRDFSPPRPDRSMPIPPIEVIEQALSGRTLEEAERLLGVNGGTLRKWRQHYGMPIAPRKGKRVLRPSIGGAETYFRKAA